MSAIIQLVKAFALTTCEEYARKVNDHASYISIVGRFVRHDGYQIWVKLGGCGESDSHQLEHLATQNCARINKMYEGRLIRLNGERVYNWDAGVWDYQWAICPVNAWEQDTQNAPENLKRMFGTNC
jgi:hypothetical protein